MNNQEAVAEFMDSVCLIQWVVQPTLAELIPLDHTAYMTAKQIWVQNINDSTEESVQLRNKAQQLMRVLHYRSQPIDACQTQHYSYKHQFNYGLSNRATTIRQQRIHSHQMADNCCASIQTQLNQSKGSNAVKAQPKKQQLGRFKQVQISINRNSRNIEQQSTVYQNKKIINNYQSAPYVSLVAKAKHTKYWDQNVDNSNSISNAPSKLHITKQQSNKQSNKYSIINQLAPDLLDQYPEFNRNASHIYTKTNKIIELNKMEYKKQIPTTQAQTQPPIQHIQPKQQIKAEDKEDNNKEQIKCKGNCVYIKYECCCRCNRQDTRNYQQDSKYLTDYGRQSRRINQFKLVSPSARESVHLKTDHNQRQSMLGRKSCSRVQKINKDTTRQKRLRTQCNNWHQHEHQKHQQSYGNNMEHSQDKHENWPNYNCNKKLMNMSLPKQKILQKHKRNNTSSFNQTNKNTQFQQSQEINLKYENSSSQKGSPQFVNKQAKIVQLKISKRKSKVNNSIQRSNEQVMMQDRKRRQQQQQAIKIKQLMQLRIRQQEEEKRRQNMLLMKLREQFSQICYQQPNEDEKRVSQEIRQLEIKLGEIVNNNRANKSGQTNSPKAKIVKLNLTPSRSNLHKNISYFNKSTTPRSPANTKSSRLLSKKIEQATKVA